jgi:hypothetical protein
MHAIKFTEWARWAGYDGCKENGILPLSQNLTSPLEDLKWPINFSFVLINSLIIDSKAFGENWSHDFDELITRSNFQSIIDQMLQYKQHSITFGRLNPQ